AEVLPHHRRGLHRRTAPFGRRGRRRRRYSARPGVRGPPAAPRRGPHTDWRRVATRGLSVPPKARKQDPAETTKPPELEISAGVLTRRDRTVYNSWVSPVATHIASNQSLFGLPFTVRQRS